MKFKRSGKTLVTFYLNKDILTVLMIFGKKEREDFEQVSSNFSEFINQYYADSKTYHDGKWMYIKLTNERYSDEIIELIKIKKKPNPRSITMCGYKCDLCKAYSKNVKKMDRRRELSNMWNKYYQLDIKAGDIYCDGCRCKNRNAKLIDLKCPVRACVTEKGINGCLDCSDYPCERFSLRVGLSKEEAEQKLANSFCEDEYYDYLLAYDNKTRFDRFKKFFG